MKNTNITYTIISFYPYTYNPEINPKYFNLQQNNFYTLNSNRAK